jgi:hypothetical protein
MVATNIINMGKPIAGSEVCIDDLTGVIQWAVGVIEDLFQKGVRQ